VKIALKLSRNPVNGQTDGRTDGHWRR